MLALNLPVLESLKIEKPGNGDLHKDVFVEELLSLRNEQRPNLKKLWVGSFHTTLAQLVQLAGGLDEFVYHIAPPMKTSLAMVCRGRMDSAFSESDVSGRLQCSCL